jgi:hypothetical protein
VVMTVVQVVSRAKADVWRFAKDVIHWVSQIQLAFQSRRRGDFVSKTKKNLEYMWYVKII